MQKSAETSCHLRVVLLCALLVSLVGCASAAVRKRLGLERPVRIGIAGFVVTAPVKSLTDLMEHPPGDLTPEQQKNLIASEIDDIEKKAAVLLLSDLNEEGKVEPVMLPSLMSERAYEAGPDPEELQKARDEGLDAVLYGEIPWYGKTRLLYPVVGISLDITAETFALGAITHWNPALIGANIGFELLTSIPLWFGGSYLFGVAFRPVSVKARIYSTSSGTELWHGTYDRIVSGRFLEKYPEQERSKKEVQLEASLANAINALSLSIGK